MPLAVLDSLSPRMPGEGFEDEAEGDGQPVGCEGEQLWAQRCKLYIYKTKASNWVQIGTGKGSLVRTMPSGRVEFLFEDETLMIPAAKQFIEASSDLQANAGTDKGWSWTAIDSIQGYHGQEQGPQTQWFTVKFATAEAAQFFKKAFDKLRKDPGTGDHLQTKIAAGQPGSPTSSAPFPPTHGGLASVHAGTSLASPPGDAWLVYFEKGTIAKGSNSMETSTIYIGAYDTKDQSILSAVRAMDTYCDKSQPWRVKDCWERREDRRKTVSDKGVIVSVENADGAFNHVKLRRVPFNLDLPPSGLTEGDDLWDLGD